MAAKELWDYIGPGELDAQATLSTPAPQQVLTEYGTKNQVLYHGDDASSVVTSVSTSYAFYVTLRWNNLSPADAGTLVDFYCGTTNADGGTKSFKWQHPTDGHTYVARFAGDLQRTIQVPEIHSIPEVRLRIVGGAAVCRLRVAKAAQRTASETPLPQTSMVVTWTPAGTAQSQGAGNVLLFHAFRGTQSQTAQNLVLQISQNVQAAVQLSHVNPVSHHPDPERSSLRVIPSYQPNSGWIVDIQHQ